MTVLLIEDNRAFAALIQRAVKDVDFHVAETLWEARLFLTSCAVDLVFVDLGLPDSSGLDTLRALSSFSVPKVVLTGSDVAAEVAQLGAADFVRKGEAKEVIERVRFNIEKVAKTRRVKFDDETFERIKSCLCAGRELAAI